MSQIVPPTVPEQPPSAPFPSPADSPPVDSLPTDSLPPETVTALAVLPAPPPTPIYVYEPEPPRKQSRLWRAIKWPIRQLLKAIYLIGRTAHRHKVLAVAALVLLIALGAGGVAAYRIANPPPSIPISDASRPAIPDSVHHWLHGFVTFNGQEMWDSLSPSMQSTMTQASSSEAALQGVLDQNKSSHVTVQYHYTGGYQTAQGASYYVVQVSLRGDNGSGELTWYFVVDDTTGKITLWQDISPQTPAGSSGSSTQGG